MNKLKTIGKIGGMPLELDDIEWVDESVREAFYGLISALGITAPGSFKLSGCEVTITPNGGNDDYACTEGYICLEGEVYKVDACTVSINPINQMVIFYPDIIVDMSKPKTFEDTSTHYCYEIRKAVLKAVTQVAPSPYMDYNAPYFTEVIRNKIKDLESTWTLVGTDPAFESGWSNLGGANEVTAFRKDAFDNVTIKGVVTSSTPTGKIFTLPLDYRPKYTRNYPCYYGTSIVVISVYSTGEVRVVDTGNTTAEIDLSLITFNTNH